MTDRSVKDNNIHIEMRAFAVFCGFAVTFSIQTRLIFTKHAVIMTVVEYNRAVDAYSDNLYRFVLKNLKNEAMASDVIQDTFEKLWVKLEDVSGLKVKTYLFTTAYHTMIDYIRKEKRYADSDPASMNTASDTGHYSDLAEILERAIQNLPEDQKAVVMLRDYEGYSYREIAEIANLSESQVKVYIYRARVYLKNYIGSMEQVI